MTTQETLCYHCGETCENTPIQLNGQPFCCEGCKLVFELLNGNDLCTYYELNKRPGVSQRITARPGKFAFLDDNQIQQQLIQFRDTAQTHVCFYIPYIHCSSCLWLLEHLQRIDPGIQRVTVNFVRKEALVIFDHHETSLRKVAELLTSTGYEPYISLQDLQHKKPPVNRQLVYQLGVAGFCFGNIMLLSFPEYFSSQGEIDPRLFRYLNILLSLPVFFYSARAFYHSAWKGLRHGFVNIDVPIVLAILVTFVRSLTDVFTAAGPGYFDAMTGIVFFMLAGRILQDKTYQGLSFDRDYTAYFPIAVTMLNGDKETPIALPDIKDGQHLLIHHAELIPADGILIKGKALIDYSFVTGESVPVACQTGDIVYAGGKQLNGNIILRTIKPVAQSYLTRLWNREELRQKTHTAASFTDLAGRYFSYIVLFMAAVTGIWWAVHDPARVWPAVTAILIVACPCGLLLAASFTNGHILRILGRDHLYLRNAAAIERLAAADHIVFDKTGTLTDKTKKDIIFHGAPLNQEERAALAALAAQSSHPLSKLVKEYCGSSDLMVEGFEHATGMGISGWIKGQRLQLGSAAFLCAPDQENINGSIVYVAICNSIRGYFSIRHGFREGIPQLLKELRKHYSLTVLSGDHDQDAAALRQLMGPHATLRFLQQPQDKLDFTLQLQQQGRCVLMIGDGLNDAGALKQSDIGISVAEDNNSFTPASDGILEARQLPYLYHYIKLARRSRQIITGGFIYALIYNMTGLFFAVQGILSPLTAAILMPASSIGIILLTWILCTLAGKKILRNHADHYQPAG